MNDGTEDALYEKRKALGITRVFKMVDTCAAEFEAVTPYFYSTFEHKSE
jgi:Carbamoyl-phosphate synthetase large chain, oligomerisation domain.